jgi:hypothetical protein
MVLPVLYETVSIQGVRVLADLASRFENDSAYTPMSHIQHIEFDFGNVDARTCSLIRRLLEQNLANLENITLKLRMISLETFRSLVSACGSKLISYTTYLDPGNIHLLPRLPELRYITRLHLVFDDERSRPPMPGDPVIMPSVISFVVTGHGYDQKTLDFVSMHRFHSACRLSVLPSRFRITAEDMDRLNPLFESHASELVTVGGSFSFQSSIFVRSRAVRLVSGTFSPELFRTGRLPQDVYFRARESSDVIRLWQILEVLMEAAQDRQRYRHETRLHLHGLPRWFTDAERDCTNSFKEQTYAHIIKCADSLLEIGVTLVDDESGRGLRDVLEQVTPSFRLQKK